MLPTSDRVNERSRLNISKYFSNRIADRWNSLPDYVINAESTNSLKIVLTIIGILQDLKAHGLTEQIVLYD